MEAAPDVYLSYQRGGEKTASAFIDQLTRAGLKVAHAGIEGARAAIFCVGISGFSPDQLTMIHAASARVAAEPDFPLLAALLPGAREDVPLPAELASRQWLDMRHGEIDRAVEAVVALLRQPTVPENRPPVTQSVRTAANSLQGDATAAEFIAAVLKLHPEYGGKRGASVSLDVTSGPRRPAEEWVNRVRGILDPEAVRELHGRLLIVALARLEPDLRDQLKQGGFLAAVETEIREPPADLFRDEPPAHEETVPTYADNPAIIDELNREGFARILGERIRSMRRAETAFAAELGERRFPQGRSFLVHVHGPWGAGKTSLLNFLRADLRKEGWIVISFNAWQHQRLAPPWWWLMSALYHQGTSELWRLSKWRAVRFRAREWWWRLKGGWRGYIVLVFSGGLIALLWREGFFSALLAGQEPADPARAIIAGVAAVLTPVLTIWGVVRSAGRWLLTSSARGARFYLDHTRDPMQETKDHFAQLVAWLGASVAILVDDLDRCKSAYVVELLEGVQTLFRDVPVVYVVAADREWLAQAYAREYSDFEEAVDEPGRSLGYLFLEKTFQMTLGVPAMTETTRDGYWRHLIQPGAIEDRESLERARNEAAELYGHYETEEEVRAALARDPGTTPVEQRARLEAAAIQLAAPMLERATEHVLQPFRPLLEPNPRAMKRLVNAYGLARGIELLSRRNLGADRQAQQRTALWTILSLRWPRFAEYLAEHPDDALAIGKGADPSQAPEEFLPLFTDAAVVAVVEGCADGVSARLDPDAIRLCVSA